MAPQAGSAISEKFDLTDNLTTLWLVSRMSLYDGDLNRLTQHFILNGKMERLVMGQRYSRGFTTPEKTELWDHWQRGE
jgi:hypothetical protein